MAAKAKAKTKAKAKGKAKEQDAIDLLGIKGNPAFVKRVRALAAKRQAKKPARVDVIRAGLAAGLSEEAVLEKVQTVWPKTRMKSVRWQAKHAEEAVREVEKLS